MKILNILLSILIVIMAALSAAAAYMLFEKRTQMLDGWQKLTGAISQTAAAMDMKSGTRLAKDLSVETLAHSNYAKLDDNLGKLKKQAQQLVGERDALAEALRRIGLAISMKNEPKIESLTELASFKGASNDIVTSVIDYNSRRDKLVKKVIDTANRVGVRINPADLKNGNVDAAFRAFEGKVSSIQQQFSTYQNNARLIGSLSNAGGLDFSDAKYSASLTKVANAVNELKSKLGNALNEINNVKRQLSAEKAVVKQRDGQIAALNNTIGRKDAEIKQYRNALGLNPEEKFAPWDPGSPEVLRMVTGKVLEVNDKFGFVALNIGKDTTVIQKIGKKDVPVSPMLTNGMDMLVARNMDTPNVQYVGKIKLTSVDKDCSIAENVELVPGAKIQVGDTVFFAESGKLPKVK